MTVLTCKYCGAPLSVEEGATLVKCEFCKNVILLVDEKDASPEAEPKNRPLSEPDVEKDPEADPEDAEDSTNDASEPDREEEQTPKKRRLSPAKKRLLCLFLAVVLVIGVVFGFKVFYSPPPELEEIYDRTVELLESANHLNTVLYGKGLPVYEKDSEYANINHLYFDRNGVPLGYLVVSDYAMYTSVEQIKAEAEQIYSREWLDTVFYPALFDGYVTEEGYFRPARYTTENNWIYMSDQTNNDLLGDRGMRIYDYSTMQIIQPSNSERVTLQLDSWLSSSPQTVLPVTVTIVLQDGQWFLNNFSG